MGCCGNKRSEYAEYLSASNSPSSSILPRAERTDISFEYIGQTGLTVTGPITGLKYRFSSPGDIQAIDYRDAGAMMAVPVLRMVGES